MKQKINFSFELISNSKIISSVPARRVPAITSELIAKAFGVVKHEMNVMVDDGNNKFKVSIERISDEWYFTDIEYAKHLINYIKSFAPVVPKVKALVYVDGKLLHTEVCKNGKKAEAFGKQLIKFQQIPCLQTKVKVIYATL